MISANGIPTMMDRVQQGQPATLYTMWERNGEQTDPGPVVVSIYSDRQGLEIISNAATSGSPGPSRSYSLTPAQTLDLDLLTLTWTGSDGSVQTSYVEIAGGFLFSVTQARTKSPLQDVNSFTTDAIVNYRTLAEMAVEDICGVAFVPRYAREEMSVEGFGVITGTRRKIRTVAQITTNLNGDQVPLTTLSGLQIVNGTTVYLPALWNWYSRPIYCAYEHGYPFAPPRVSNAVLLLARRWLIESPWDERTTGFRTRDGGEMSILTATHSEAFDLPEVVAVADAYGMPAVY